MSGCPSENELVDLVGAALPSARAERMRAHIDGCAACHAAVVALAHAADGAPDDHDPGSAMPRPGDRFADRYRLQAVVGQGASGVVYAALDVTLDRRVALKILRSSDHRSPASMAARLTRESRAMARLRHPNVVTIFDVGIREPHMWVAMELVEGRSLRAWLRSQPGVAAVLAVFAGAAEGLAAAHAAGIVHRDFKPDNVLVDDAGVGYVTDFGLAAAAAESRLATHDPEVDPNAPQTWTRSGTIVGTPAYLSPEGWRGETVDARADVFALCVSLYEALVGRRPFAGTNAADVQDAIASGRVASTRVPAGVSRSLWAEVLAGLRADPDARPPLPTLVAKLRPRARTRRSMAVAVAVPLGLGLAGALTWNAWREGDAPAPRHPACMVTPRGPMDRAVPEAFATFTTETAAGPAAAQEVSDAADAFVAQWNATRQRVCTAPASDAAAISEIDLRLRCLDLRWAAFETQVELLPTVADPRAMARRFPDAANCEDPDIAATLPLPDGPARARVSELWTALVRIQERQTAGGYASVDAELGELVAQARETGSLPLLADALYVQGSGLQFTAEYPRARKVLLEAAHTAVAAGFDASAALSFNALTYLSVEAMPDLERAEEYLAYAYAAIARMRRPALAEELRVQVLYHEGLLRVHQQRWDDAARVIEQGSASARKVQPEIVPQFQDLRAIALAEQGDLEGSARAAEAALHARERILGPDHPYLAFSRQLLAGILAEKGDLSGAVEHTRIAREISIAAFGPVNPQVSVHWQQEGLLLTRLGEIDAAEAAFDAAEAATTEADRTDTWWDTQLAGQVDLAFVRDDGEAAVELATRHLDVARRIDPRGEGPQWIARAGLAMAWVTKGEPARGLPEVQAWLDARAGLVQEHQDRVTCALASGDVFVALGRWDDAHAILVEMLEGDHPPSPGMRAELQTRLARAYFGRGETAAARRALDDALSYYRSMEADDNVAAELAWAGEVGLAMP